jgi:hypothetical protein
MLRYKARGRASPQRLAAAGRGSPRAGEVTLEVTPYATWRLYSQRSGRRAAGCITAARLQCAPAATTAAAITMVGGQPATAAAAAAPCVAVAVGCAKTSNWPSLYSSSY